MPDRPNALSTRGDAAFRRGLAEFGFGLRPQHNIDYRWADGRVDRLPEFQSISLRRGGGDAALAVAPAELAAKRATATIPIVFSFAAIPVAAGLVRKSPTGQEEISQV